MTTRDMNNNEAIQMLNRCKHEITQMRTELDYLRPKAEAYDNLKIALSFARTSQGYGQVSEDIIWVIQKRIDELTPKPEANPVPEPTHELDPNKSFIKKPNKDFITKTTKHNLDRDNDE